MKFDKKRGDFVCIVQDIDLRQPQKTAVVAALRAALLESKVLVFPQQKISPAQYIAFCRHFGKIWRTDDEMKLEAHFQFEEFPELVRVSNKNGVLGPMELEYHADGSHHPVKSYPARGLFAWELPDHCDGSTTWLDMTAAYVNLPSDMKLKIENLKARHIPRYSTGWESAEVYHPLVRVHPVTGTRSLSVDAYFTRYIQGLPDEESQQLLNTLLQFAKDQAPTYTHIWSQYDIVIFDNNNTLHRRNRIRGEQERLLLRTTMDLHQDNFALS